MPTTFKSTDMTLNLHRLTSLEHLAINSILWVWMFSNGLRLDTDKTQLVWLGTKHLLFKVDYASLISPFPNLTFSNCIKNLGFASTVTWPSKIILFDFPIPASTDLGGLRLFVLRFICLVNGFVTIWLDYCNAFYFDLPKNLISTLQFVLNSVACLVVKAPCYFNISDFFLNTLHWLPV